MIFLAPQALVLLVLVPLLWLLPRRVRRPSDAVLRSLVVLFLVLALAGPASKTLASEPYHVVVLDRSASVLDPERATQRARRVLASLPPDAHRMVVVIGDEPDALDAERLVRLDDEAATPLSEALDLAGLLIPRGAPGAVTLLSDGRATDPHYGEAMQAFAARGIPLHVLPLPTDESRLRLVGLDVDRRLVEGQTAHVRVTLAGSAARAQLTLDLDGEEVASTGVDVRGRTTVALELEAPAAGFPRLGATVTSAGGGDAVRMERVVAVQDPLRVLYLGGRIQGASARLQALLGAGFDVRPIHPTDPAFEGRLGACDVLVLDDCPATRLGTAAAQTIADQVRGRGLGVLLSGGRQAFGPGGWRKTPIESIAPVRAVQMEEKKDPSTTLVVVIDTSGSMGGNRVTLAKEVARLAIRRLLPHDKVGIVEFYGTKQWAAPIQSAANVIDLQRALNRLDAGGGTVLYPGIEEAFYALKNVQTRYKHVIVITDAGVETGPYESLLRRMSREGIAVSTALVGPGRHSEFLVELADWGGGRYYHAPDRFNLPELLLKQPDTSSLPAYRAETVEVDASGLGAWAPSLDGPVPPLAGFVEVEAREGAEVALEAVASKHPLLASWEHGLGRVTALMTEPVGSGTQSWRDWPAYGRLLGRILARTGAATPEAFDVRVDRRRGRVTVEVRVLRPGLPTPTLRWVRADGQGEPLPLALVAPGAWLARFDAGRADARIELHALSRVERRVASRLIDGVDEHAVDPARAFPLREAARVTDGRVLEGDEGIALEASAGRGVFRLRSLAPTLLLAALLFFLLDLAWRRRPGRKEVTT